MHSMLDRARAWFGRGFSRRRSQEYDSLRLVAESSGDVIFRFGADGKARYISPSVSRLLGCSPKDIYAMGGDVISNSFVEEVDRPAIAAAVEKHFLGELPETKLEFRVRRTDGSVVWVETNCSTIVDVDTGRPTDIVFTMRDVSEKKAYQLALEALARTDALTGLANRRAFDEALLAEWRRTIRAGTQLSLLLIDVDCFKTFNDVNGHQVGDDCLRTIAGCIRNSVTRPCDLAARYGGEEFAIILGGVGRSSATSIAERVRDAVEMLQIPHSASLVGDHVTISVGAATAMAISGGSIEMPEGLLQAADKALYAAKREGRNRVEASLLLAPSERLRIAS